MFIKLKLFFLITNGIFKGSLKGLAILQRINWAKEMNEPWENANCL